MDSMTWSGMGGTPELRMVTALRGWRLWTMCCQELTTLWVARLDDGAELKVTDPEEQQGDVEEEEAEG